MYQTSDHRGRDQGRHGSVKLLQSRRMSDRYPWNGRHRYLIAPDGVTPGRVRAVLIFLTMGRGDSDRRRREGTGRRPLKSATLFGVRGIHRGRTNQAGHHVAKNG